MLLQRKKWLCEAQLSLSRPVILHTMYGIAVHSNCRKCRVWPCCPQLFQTWKFRQFAVCCASALRPKKWIGSALLGIWLYNFQPLHRPRGTLYISSQTDRQTDDSVMPVLISLLIWALSVIDEVSGVAKTGELVHVKDGIQQSVVFHSLMVVRGQFSTVAASLHVVQMHDGFVYETSWR